MGNEERVAVVTGGNRGLGLETCRQLARRGYTVVLTARRPEEGEQAAAALADEGTVRFRPLDVTDEKSVAAFVAWLREAYGRVDVLVNNAGAIFDDGEAGILETDLEPLRRSFETNTLGALRVSRALVPMMVDAGHGCVVNVSSGMGAVTDMSGGWPGYRLSKAALNALTRILHSEAAGGDVKINAVCPGWVRTDMGGGSATRSIPDGAKGIVWAATLPRSGPSGGFFRDGEPIDW